MLPELPPAQPRRQRQTRVPLKGEAWLRIPSHPNYEVSSYRRVRPVLQADPNAVLKPIFEYWGKKKSKPRVRHTVRLNTGTGRMKRVEVFWLTVEVAFAEGPPKKK